MPDLVRLTGRHSGDFLPALRAVALETDAALRPLDPTERPASPDASMSGMCGSAEASARHHLGLPDERV